MLKKKKYTFYFKHLLLMSGVNKIRLFLTSVGIFVAVFLFAVGVIISNSYYNEKLNTVDEMADKTVIISSPDPLSNIKEDMAQISSAIPSEDFVLNKNVSILSTPVSDNTYVTVMARFHGVTKANSLLPVISDDGNFLPENVTLIEGRFFVTQDLAERSPVVMIDEFTAELLYPGESAIGKTIDIDTGIGGAASAPENGGITAQRRAEIIGVVKNSYISETRRLSLKKDLQSMNKSNFFVEVSVYCPINMISEWFPDDVTNRYYIYSFENAEDYISFLNKAEALSELNIKNGNAFDISTKEALMTNLENELSYTKGLLNLIMLALCVISGISIMSVTFFSVKERISEIGIRKAFGASKVDIVFQFIFEMLIIAFFVSIVAVCLAYYCCRGAEIYLASNLFISFKVSIPLYQLALPVVVGLTEAMLSSIVPSIYAANIKVTDALRFE